MGRIDFQVKISGLRIELGEIENALAQYDGMVKAVVVTKQSSSQLPVLCAYYLAPNRNTSGKFKRIFSSHVPAYMIPSFFVHMEELPVNSSGKIDRKVLLQIQTIKINLIRNIRFRNLNWRTSLLESGKKY